MVNPSRPRQHILETSSGKALSNFIPDNWIIRGVTESDYGIDYEIELVKDNGEVTGKFFKLQLKATDKIYTRKDGFISLSQIKMTTINYWISLNKQTHVFVCLFDSQTGNLYWTNIFEQATRLVSSNKKTTIHFSPTQVARREQLFTIIKTVLGPLPFQVKDKHKSLLKNIEIYKDSYWYIGRRDLNMPLDIEGCDFFEQLLEDFKIICWNDYVENENEYQIDYWVQKSNYQYGDALASGTVAEALRLIYPKLLKRLTELQVQVIAANTYWNCEDPDYSYLVKGINLPSKLDSKSIFSWAAQA
ncbi:DUF4365 domain-containing protein [Bacillus toyonensis]